MAAESESSLVDAYDALLLDLDGVVYAGPRALPGAAERLGRLRSRGLRLLFVTNNAARTPDDVAEHLQSLGIPAEDSDVLTSAQAAARMVTRLVPRKAPVLVVGGVGLATAVEAEGLTVVDDAEANPAAVVQGFHPDIGWRQLAEGAYAVARGLPWVASNIDRTLPTERGMAPGNGALVETIRMATGREPDVAGKPAPALFEEALRHGRVQRPLVVGDRLDTDIAGAQAAGYPSLLVLTGVTDLRRLAAGGPSERPTYVGADLGALLRPGHALLERDGRMECGGWSAQIVSDSNGMAVQLDGDGQPADGLHAAAAAVWAAGEKDGFAPDAIDVSEAEHRCRLG